MEKIEKKMYNWCDTAKGKDKTMVRQLRQHNAPAMPARPLRCLASRFRRGCARQCYYIGVGDKESGTAGGVKRDISSSFARGINAKRLCTRLKKKDAQMCELRYEKKVDVKNTDLKKLRVKELRKIADDEGIDVKGARRAAPSPTAHTRMHTGQPARTQLAWVGARPLAASTRSGDA